MGVVELYRRFTWSMGLIAAISAWLVIGICIYFNPWFVFTIHAFSDLGAPEAKMPWIYNYGLISVGILILLYSLYLLLESRNKLESMGSSFMFVAGIFLILIGLFPSGTKPHNFVSTWFFIQADFAIVAWGLGLIVRKLVKLGSLITIMGLLSPVFAMLIEWPSAATIEAYGIIVIDIWVVILTKILWSKS